MKIITLLCTALLSVGCTQVRGQTEYPALIANNNADTRAELLQVVRAALNDAPLLLADSALTQDSVLIVERTPRLDPTTLNHKGLPIDGRTLAQPERFLLYTDGVHCVLVHERTQRRWVLTRTQCKKTS